MKICLVEDDKPTRLRLAALLLQCLPHAQLIQFDRLTQAVVFAGQHKADYWLVDLGLPDGSGIDLIRRVRAQDTKAHILVISVFGDVDNVIGSISSGANGYLLKDAVDKDLIAAIEAMEVGGTPLSPMIASRVLSTMKPQTTTSQHTPTAQPTANILTRKEAELLNLLSRGYTYAECAHLMGVATSTVQSHVRNIYAKLRVSSRAEAIFEAKAMGLIH